MKKPSEMTREEKDRVIMGEDLHGFVHLPPEKEERPKPARDYLEVICMADMKPKAVRWVWKNMLPAGMFTILAGQQGQGKTTICMSLAATISSGGTFPDGTRADPGHVLIWSGEDGTEMGLMPKLIAMGADMTRMHAIGARVKNGKKFTFDPAKHMSDVLQEVERIGDVRLLIIDSIVSAVGGDDHKNADVRRALQPIVDIAAATGMAVIGITHYRKGTKESAAIERVMGSLAYTAVARSVLCVGKRETADGKKENILVLAKSSYSKNGGGFKYSLKNKILKGYIEDDISTNFIIWGEHIDGEPDDLLSEPSEYEKENKSAMEEAKEFIIENLTDITPSKDFIKDARQAGIPERTLERARKELGVRAKKSEDKWYLCPTEYIRNLQKKQDRQQDAEVIDFSQHQKAGGLGGVGGDVKNQQLTEHEKGHFEQDRQTAKIPVLGDSEHLTTENGGEDNE